MKSRILTALAFAAALLPAGVLAHGGGGGGGGGHGGGHGGGSYVYFGGGGGGAIYAPKAIVGDTSGIHKVAILSGIGQTMTLGTHGWFVSSTVIPIDEMKLDDLMDRGIREHLGTRFTFADVHYDRAALSAIPAQGTGALTVPLHNYLAALPPSGVDAYIVVLPDAESVANTAGLSLAANDAGPGRPALHAMYEIDIVDAHSFQIISHVFSRITLRQDGLEHFASLIGPATLNITPKETPTPAQRILIQDHFTFLLSTSLIETLRALQLGVSLPDPGARTMVPLPAAMNPFPNVKNVAVVSVVGDALDFNHRAPWFKHEQTTVSGAQMGLDDTIEGQVRAALDKRLTVKTVVVDRAKLGGLMLKIDQSSFAAPVDGLKPDAVDAYIVVLKRSTPLGADVIQGLGLAHAVSISDEHTYAFAMYEIAVIDGHTLKPLVLRAGTSSPAMASTLPFDPIANSVWPKDGAALSPEQTQLLHDTLLHLMADSIPETLLHLRLTGVISTLDLPKDASPSGTAPALPPPPKPSPKPSTAAPH